MPEQRLGSRDILAEFAAHRRRLGRRRYSLAEAAAENILPELAALANGRPDADVEDAICTRLGEHMAKMEDVGDVEDSVDPNCFIEAMVEVAARAVRSAPEPDNPNWRVLIIITRILPHPLSEQAAVTMAELRAAAKLSAPPDVVVPTGPVLWTRDAYGSRFGIAAKFSTSDGPDRWYLWDVDVCGMDSCTVYSGYFSDADSALAEWRSVVGVVAAVDAEFTPVDDTELLWNLLPAEECFMRIGGENAAQMAEYHRSKRLAEEVRKHVEPLPNPHRDRLDADDASQLATDWLAEHPAECPANVEELVAELADYWKVTLPGFYSACSPHRVANAVSGIRDYYLPDFADELVKLLPAWVTWLSEYKRISADLAQRAIDRAREAAAQDAVPWNPLARIAE